MLEPVSSVLTAVGGFFRSRDRHRPRNPSPATAGCRAQS